MSWDYIKATIKEEFKKTYSHPYQDVCYSLEELVDIFNKENKTSFKGQKNNINDQRGTSFFIKSLDGQCGVMIVHDIRIFHYDDIPLLDKLIQYLARAGNYTKVLISHTNPNIIKEAKNQGYYQIKAFHNKRTHNEVKILMKGVVYENQNK